ncbi:hypothetical protein SAMN03159507_03162 [Pseudomonas sp. NFACC32-1]|uniref:hypothetical protein n=1 Tax=Pseudomonas TaxID=286 RepID=UPI000876AE3F|nr:MULTISPECIES: hypothetical protein [Pseudomonas]MDT8909140.1 hypothetical protein [Pseudomonas prosekii]NHN68200.1 hypothetical protein [Pseudomonas fluorescens]ROO36122.1 hypothetical protein BIV08_23275 [Pseudomonas sp. AF76]ROO40407.1 hypothetical protein BIV09_09970 [Pseudomonas sp. 7SR1]SCX65756.1 hypothetical protein SAMN03159507_03162 [Pseudomonas sp. NFACC32-1]
MPTDYIVTKRQAQLLRLGNAVIDIIKGLTPYGSGNQLDEEYAASHIRTAATYNFMENPVNSAMLRPRRILEIAKRTGAGNCDQLGAMAYAICRDYLSSDYYSAWVGTNAHTFALIGHNSGDAEDAIAVDAWPQRPQAVLYKHHFCYGMQFDTHVAKPGTGRGRYKESTAAEGLNFKMSNQWDAVFNNAEIQNWRYENNNVVTPWRGRQYRYVTVG